MISNAEKVVANLGKLLGKLIFIVVDFLSIDVGPFEQSPAEIDKISAVQWHNELCELLVGDVVS